jgi:hypothetical protein
MWLPPRQGRLFTHRFQTNKWLSITDTSLWLSLEVCPSRTDGAGKTEPSEAVVTSKHANMHAHLLPQVWQESEEMCFQMCFYFVYSLARTFICKAVIGEGSHWWNKTGLDLVQDVWGKWKKRKRYVVAMNILYGVSVCSTGIINVYQRSGGVWHETWKLIWMWHLLETRDNLFSCIRNNVTAGENCMFIETQ